MRSGSCPLLIMMLCFSNNSFILGRSFSDSFGCSIIVIGGGIDLLTLQIKSLYGSLVGDILGFGLDALWGSMGFLGKFVKKESGT